MHVDHRRSKIKAGPIVDNRKAEVCDATFSLHLPAWEVMMTLQQLSIKL